MRRRTSLRGGACAALLMALPVCARGQDWPMGGADLSNTRSQPGETVIGAHNVSRLRPKWVFTTGGDVSATPAVAAGAVYVPDWAGNLFKVDAATGAAVWTHRIPDSTGATHGFARVTPAVAEGVLYVGTQKGAWLLAVSTATGALRWKTLLDPHRDAGVTQSAVVHEGRVYVGVSSEEEVSAALFGYRCCTFRGSVVALDAATGAIVWRTYTTPENRGEPGGWSGVAVWGSTPVVDGARGLLYVTTGNNYSVPPGTSGVPADNHVDAVMALELQTGAVRWSSKMQGPDAWNVACVPFRRRNCPDPAGPDYDFAQGALAFTVEGPDGPRPLLGAGQKSGIFWALEPATGDVVWSAIVGPPGVRGGMQFGSATDGRRIYAAAANSGRRTMTLPSGETTNGGAYTALDAATGAILWQTAVPRRALALGPLTVANGVVYGGSMLRFGPNMFALDAATGQIRWRFGSGGSVASGPAVAGGTVYWGSGYSKYAQGRANNKLYAFSVDGR
jgi:polyvinyl alcohol dehydrogenase (cytochrome)